MMNNNRVAHVLASVIGRLFLMGALLVILSFWYAAQAGQPIHWGCPA